MRDQSIEDYVRALAPSVYQRMAGDVMPLPINPGPQAGRPSAAQQLQGLRQGVPYIGPQPDPLLVQRLQRAFTPAPSGQVIPFPYK